MEVIDLETLRYEVRGAGAWFVLTREKQMNALSPALIRDLADSGLTVVMVSHDPKHAQLADHVIEITPLRTEE